MHAGVFFKLLQFFGKCKVTFILTVFGQVAGNNHIFQIILFRLNGILIQRIV